MIDRGTDLRRLRHALGRAPVVLLVGPRQAGKTTLAREITRAAGAAVHFLDAENPRDLARLADPMLALESLRGTVIVDEAQHVPGLFPVLRVLVDRPDRQTRFLILGSASPTLVGLGAESLAGRVEIVELDGLRVADVGPANLDPLWLRGALPPAYTAASQEDSMAWRDNYIATFLERDLAGLGFRTPATTMRRAWTMLAHFHGQLWNGAELARSLGVSEPTARRYLDALTDALVVRQLQPWFANISKRQVRSPKVYVRDSGTLHRLLGIGDEESLHSHPKVGASYEGFVIEQLAQICGRVPLYFWRTQQGAELDLYLELGGKRIGVEVKRSSAPKLTASMRNAKSDLDLDHLLVVYPGPDRFPLAPGIRAIPDTAVLDVPDVDALLRLAR